MSYYTPTGNPSDSTRGIAQLVRDEFDLIAAGFNLLPVPAAILAGYANYAVNAGTADALSVTLSPAVVAYVDGMTLLIKAPSANTGATTINVNSLGLKSITRADGSELQAGDIKAGQIIQVSYSTTNGKFQLVATGAAADAAAAAASAAAAQLSRLAAETAETGAETAEFNAQVAEALALDHAQDAEDQANLAAQYAQALQGTSVTSLLIATGSKAFTASTGKQWASGQFIVAASAANNDNYMHGQVTSYDPVTGALVVNVTNTGGLGTLSDWLITVSGTRGAVGPSGAGAFVRVTGTTQTAVAGNQYFMQNVALSTLTLPVSASDGDQVSVTFENTLQTNVVARNGLRIMGLLEDLTVDSAQQTVRLRYDDAAFGWRLI